MIRKLKALWCRWRGHQWRRPRATAVALDTNAILTINQSWRICSRCGATRAVKPRKAKLASVPTTE